MSPALTAMNDRVTLLEEGLYHARMDALVAQRELATGVLGVLEEGNGEELRALRTRLEGQREEWTRRQGELSRERGGGAAAAVTGEGSSMAAEPGRAGGGGGPKGILGLLNS